MPEEMRRVQNGLQEAVRTAFMDDCIEEEDLPVVQRQADVRDAVCRQRNEQKEFHFRDRSLIIILLRNPPRRSRSARFHKFNPFRGVGMKLTGSINICN